MDRDELIRRIEAARNGFLDAIAGLNEDEMTSLPVAGGWTVKDILAHLTAWEAEMVSGLAQLRTGARPRYFNLAETDLNGVNAKWFDESRDRPLDRVRADFDGVRRQMLRRLALLSDGDLFTRGRFRWMDGRPLVDWIVVDTLEHYEEHAGDVRAWRSTRGK